MFGLKTVIKTVKDNVIHSFLFRTPVTMLDIVICVRVNDNQIDNIQPL